MCASKRKTPASKSETKPNSITKKSKPASNSESEQNTSGSEASDKEFVPSKEETESEEEEEVEEKEIETDDKFTGFVKNDAGEHYMGLCGNQRRITIRTFKGKTYIDIREFYEKDGKFLPGKKGISLTVEQWESIREASKQIDSCIKNLKVA